MKGKRKGRLESVSAEEWAKTDFKELVEDGERTMKKHRFAPASVEIARRAYKAYSFFLTNCPEALAANGGQEFPILADTMMAFLNKMAGLGYKQLHSIYYGGLHRTSKMLGHKIEYGAKISGYCSALTNKSGTKVKHVTPMLAEDIYHTLRCLRPNVSRNARNAAILLGGLSWGKRVSSLFALRVENLVFKTDGSSTLVEATFHFDKVMKEAHTLSLTPHPEKCKDPVYALIKSLAVRGVFVGDPFQGDYTIKSGTQEWPVFCAYSGDGQPLNEVPFAKGGISNMVTELAAHAGYPPLFTVHSLRAGMATCFVLSTLKQNNGQWTDQTWPMIARVGGWAIGTTGRTSAAQEQYVNRVLDQAIDTTANVAGVERVNKVSESLMKHEHDEDKIKRSWNALPDLVLQDIYTGLSDDLKNKADRVLELHSKKARRQRELDTLEEERMISWDWASKKSDTPTSEEITKLADKIKSIAAKARQIDRELNKSRKKLVRKWILEWGEANHGAEIEQKVLQSAKLLKVKQAHEDYKNQSKDQIDQLAARLKAFKQTKPSTKEAKANLRLSQELHTARQARLKEIARLRVAIGNMKQSLWVQYSRDMFELANKKNAPY